MFRIIQPFVQLTAFSINFAADLDSKYPFIVILPVLKVCRDDKNDFILILAMPPVREIYSHSFVIWLIAYSGKLVSHDSLR